jgi:magnesium transporter
MIRSLYRSRDGQVRIDLKPDQLATALQDINGTLWVDFVSESADVCEPILRETFGFHPLAIEDALQESHSPKVDNWDDYLYLVLHAVASDKWDSGQLDTLELDVFLGKNYIITYHAHPIPIVDRVWGACQRDERHLNKGTNHLLYKLADELAASYMPIVEEIDETIELLEDQIFGQPTQAALEQIFALKRTLLHLRRTITPQREVINKLARDEYAIIDAEDRVFFRDVYDHFTRLHYFIESTRDLVSGALEIYLSAVNNRMNQVMRTLAIITALFMPISFLTGFFGMNFFHATVPLDIWTSEPVFVLTIGAMLLIPIGWYLWIRQRAWM